jgi:Uma2 family endonuclease
MQRTCDQGVQPKACTFDNTAWQSASLWFSTICVEQRYWAEAKARISRLQRSLTARLDATGRNRLLSPVIAPKPRIPTRRAEPRRWTFDEMAAELPETNLPTELWDGELVRSPSPSFFHQEIVARFHKLLDAWVEQHRLGKTAFAPLDMVLAPRRAVQPDVIFISKERSGITGARVQGAADLVAEVLSPGSRRRDRLDKRDHYEQHGAQEYWLIDPEARTVEVLFLERGEYQLVGRWQPEEQAASRLVNGFKVSVNALFGSGLSVKSED